MLAMSGGDKYTFVSKVDDRRKGAYKIVRHNKEGGGRHHAPNSPLVIELQPMETVYPWSRFSAVRE